MSEGLWFQVAARTDDGDLVHFRQWAKDAKEAITMVWGRTGCAHWPVKGREFKDVFVMAPVEHATQAKAL